MYIYERLGGKNIHSSTEKKFSFYVSMSLSSFLPMHVGIVCSRTGRSVGKSILIFVVVCGILPAFLHVALDDLVATGFGIVGVCDLGRKINACIFIGREW